MSLEPGFLDFDNLPDTNFSCVGKVIGGYYADLETNCQMFHVCTIGQLDEPMDIRFLCLNGTVFDQETRVCERIDEVDCSKSEQFYSLNLELYGNTQPPILEESPEIDFPAEVKRSSTSTTTTTTTTQRPSRPKSTSPPYYTTSSQPTTTRGVTKVITSHHFPVVSAPDIRFNPEEINISLNPGSPPDITRSQVPISFQQQSYSEKNTRVTVTTHTTIYKNDKPHRVPLLPTPNPPSQILVEHEHLERPKLHEATQPPKSVVSYGLTHNQGSQVANPTEINYGFNYQQTEESIEYHTEIPPHPYQYQLNIANLRPPSAQSHPYHATFHATSKRPQKLHFPAPTTYRNHPAYTSSAKAPPQQFHSQRTERPPRLQLPLPLLPTLPPLTFSSPAPFSLGRHIEAKRYTSDHQSQPRIIISASASVSDNSGRRLNYSLGTIGATHLLGPSPPSYDDYKEDDVGLDPFYHDVPKIKSTRHKRSVMDEATIKNDQEAADLLKFLFNWYKKRENTKKISIPVAAEDITEINDELAPLANIEASTSAEDDYETLFRKMVMENMTAPDEEKEHRKILKTDKNNTEHVDELIQLSEDVEDSKNDKRASSDVDGISNEVRRRLFEKNNTTPSNFAESSKNEDQVQTSTAKSANNKKKRTRNHRRRTNKPGTTRGTKKPKTSRQQNHPDLQNPNSELASLIRSINFSKHFSKNRTRNSSRIANVPRKTDNILNNLEFPRPPTDYQTDNSDKINSQDEDEQKSSTTTETYQENEAKSTTKTPAFDLSTHKPLVYVSGAEKPSTTETYQENEAKSTTTTPAFDLSTYKPLVYVSGAEKPNKNLETSTVSQEEKSTKTKLKFSAKIKSTGESGVIKHLSKLSEHHDHNLELMHEDQVETHESKQRERVTDVHGTTEFPITTDHYGSEDYDMDYHRSTELNYETTTDKELQDRFSTTTEEPITTLQPESRSLDNEQVTAKNVETIPRNDQNIQDGETTTLFLQENEKALEKLDADLVSKDVEYKTEEDLNKNEAFSTESDLLEQTTSKPDNYEQSTDTLHIDLLNSEKNSATETNTEKLQTQKEHQETTEHSEIYSTTSASEDYHEEEYAELYTSTENSFDDEEVNQEQSSKKPEEETLENKGRNLNKLRNASRRIYESTSAEEELVISPKSSTRLRFRRPEDQKRTNSYVRNRKFIASSLRGAKNTGESSHIKSNHNFDYDNPLAKKYSTSEESIKESETPGIPDYVDDNYEPLTYRKPSELKEYDQLSDTTTHDDSDLEEYTVTDALQHLDDFGRSANINEAEHFDDHTTAVSSDYEDHIPSQNTFNKEAETEPHTTSAKIDENSSTIKVESTTMSREAENVFTTTDSIETTHSDQADSLLPTTDSHQLTTEAYAKYTEEPSTEFSSTVLTTQTVEITTIPTTTETKRVHNDETTNEPTTTLQDSETSTITPTEYHQTTSTSTESMLSSLRSHTTDYPAEETTINMETTQATSVTPSSTTDSATTVTSLTEPDYQVDFTTPFDDTTTNRYQHLKTRLPWYKRQDTSRRKQNVMHRFNTVNRRKGLPEKPKLEHKVKHVLNNSFSNISSSSKNNTEELLEGRKNNTAKLSDAETSVNSNNSNNVSSDLDVKDNKQIKLEHPHPATPLAMKSDDLIITTTASEEESEDTPTTIPTIEESVYSGENRAEIAITDAPLLKSANPTKAKYTKIVFTTTPLSKLVRVELRKDIHGKRYTFNCFNKKVHQFYSDPRDCRLFHYCTSGYTKNQMVDMKFVCDLGTYFDDEKLICTKEKPARCL